MADGNLGQDDIDRMLAEMGAGEPAAPAKPPEPPPPAQPAAAAAPSADASGPLGQDQIDALVAQATESTAPKPSAASTATGQLGQDEIDKLLADLDPATRAHAAPGQTGRLSQDHIDKLLGDLEVPGGGQDSEVAKASVSKTGQPAAKPAEPAAAAKAPAAAEASAAKGASAEGPLSQDDIDKLLSQLGASTKSIGAEKTGTVKAAEAATAKPTRTVPPAPAPVEAKPKDAEQTASLTPEEIDRIVAKQAESPPGHDSEAVIAQSDIDALVKQLASATGAHDAENVADAIANRAEDIDRVQAEAAAAEASPELTKDAVDVNGVLGHTASTTTGLATPHGMATVATVATFEWRFAQWLLAAAVLFLCFCTGALIVLTGSVRQLSGELRAEREAEHPAVDGYADKLRLALAKLDEADEAERARGVRWMEELKRQHPERAADVGLALARHFRSREAWRRASDEYGAALEVMGGIADDPRILLEQADCQARLGDETGAVRTIYALLAGESRWLAERTADGRPAPEIDRNRQAVADAYLVLGRLLARGPAAVASQISGPASPSPAAAAGEPAAHAGHGGEH